MSLDKDRKGEPTQLVWALKTLTVESADPYLPAFMADYNRRFGVVPRNPADAHRAVLHDDRELDLILCEHHARKVTGNLSISFKGDTYQGTGHAATGCAARR